MPSPLLHGAAGLAVYTLAKDRRRRADRRTPALIVLAALLPDCDFLPGLLLGAPNRFHSDWTHSLGFVAVAAILLGLLSPPRRLRMMISAFLAGLTHVILDAMTYDGRPPLGVPMFWPLSSTHFQITPFLRGFRHAGDGATLADFFRDVISWQNLVTLAIEGAIALALIAACTAFRRVCRRGDGRAKPTGAPQP